MEIRGSLLAGLNPNDGTISWAEFQEVAQDQTTREIVETEMIYVPPDTRAPPEM
jgi:hypothetical protein